MDRSMGSTRKAIMLLLKFIISMIHYGAVTGIEEKVDKKGRPFTSIKFNKNAQRPDAWIKSVVVYQRTDGGIYLLINHGGVNTRTENVYSAFSVLTLKKVVSDYLYENTFVVLQRGKNVGWATDIEVNCLNNARVW